MQLCQFNWSLEKQIDRDIKNFTSLLFAMKVYQINLGLESPLGLFIQSAQNAH